MAPLPVEGPNVNAVINSYSYIYSCLPVYPDQNPPPTTNPEEAATVQTMDSEAPSIPPATLTPSQLPLSTEFEWEPPVSKTETLLEISDVGATNDYQKRLGIVLWPSPPVAAIPTLLTNNFKTVQDQERPATAMDRTPVGEYRFSFFQALSLVIFIFLVSVYVRAAAMSAMNRIERKLYIRLTIWQGEIMEDQRMYDALHCVVYCAIVLGLWSILLFGAFGLHQIWQAAI